MGQPPPHGESVGLFLVTKKKETSEGFVVTLVGENGSATFFVPTEKGSYYVVGETLELLTTKP